MSGKSYTYEDYKQFVEYDTNNEYILLNTFKKMYGKTTKVSIPYFRVKHIKCGKEYDVPAFAFIKGTRCKCTIFKTIEDIRKEIKMEDGYALNGMHRKSGRIYLSMTHTECNNIYDVSYTDWKAGRRCKSCMAKKMWDTRGRITAEEITDEIEHDCEYIITDMRRENKRIKIGVVHSVCGYEFETEWQRWKSGKRCKKCKSTAKPVEYWLQQVEDVFCGEYSFEGLIKRKQENSSIILKHSSCGNSFTTNSREWKRFKCPICNTANGLLTDDDMKKRVDIATNDEFKFISKRYIRGNNGKYQASLKIQHDKCGSVFDKLYVSWMANQTCEECSMKLSVSYLHAVSALLFKRYYKGVELEKDIGYRGVNGGVSKYDLYIPNLNGRATLIEFQSRYHDFEDKKINDYLKKEYALDKGYDVIYYDSRVTTIDEILKLYFKNLKHVPDDIINEVKMFNKNVDLAGAQDLLDKNISIPKIAKILGVTKWNIYGAIESGRLVKSEHHGKVQIVMLRKNGEYVNEFNSITECEKTTGIRAEVSLLNNSITKDGYYFVRREDYYSENYSIPKEYDKGKQNRREVVKINKETLEKIEQYNSVREAAEDNNMDRNTISKACKNDVVGKGFKWMYKDDYEKSILTKIDVQKHSEHDIL